MSRDRGTQHQRHDYGSGQACTMDGELIDGYVVSSANQEHGILSAQGEADGGVATWPRFYGW